MLLELGNILLINECVYFRIPKLQTEISKHSLIITASHPYSALMDTVPYTADQTVFTFVETKRF